MPTLLDEFILSFSTNASKAAGDLGDLADKSKGAAGGLQGAANRSDGFNSSIFAGITPLNRIIGLLAGYVTVAKLLGLSDQADALGKTAALWGLNASEINTWGQANVRFGGTLDQMNSTILGLTKGLNEIAITGSGSLLPVLSFLGIAAIDVTGKARDFSDVLLDIADGISGLTASEAATLGTQLGIDDSTLRLLREGRNEVNKVLDAQKTLGIITDDDTKIFARLNNTLADTAQIFGNMGRGIGSFVAPAIIDGLNHLNSFLLKTRDILSSIGEALEFLTLNGALKFIGDIFSGLKERITPPIVGQGETRYPLKVDPSLQGNAASGVIDKGNALLSQADNFPLNPLSNAAISNSSLIQNRGSSVNIGDITINTKATDADGVGSEIRKTLEQQMRSTVNSFDDGLLA